MIGFVLYVRLNPVGFVGFARFGCFDTLWTVLVQIFDWTGHKVVQRVVQAVRAARTGAQRVVARLATTGCHWHPVGETCSFTAKSAILAYLTSD